MRQFHTTQIGNRDYILGIVKDDFKYFPITVAEEHQEMIIIDLKCKENLLNLLNQVCFHFFNPLFQIIKFITVKG